MLHEIRAQNPHETGKADDIGPGRVQHRLQGGLETGAITLEGPVIDHSRGNAPRRRLFKAPRIGAVGQNQHRARGMIAHHAVGQRDHVRPAARNQDGDPFMRHSSRPL